MASPRLFIPADIDASAIARRPQGAPIVDVGGATMGTRWSLRFASKGVDAERAAAVVQGACDLVVAEMSQWEPGSALSRFNRAARGSWQVLPAHFFHVLTAALEVASATGGAFDPTIGALSERWGFSVAPISGLPTEPDFDRSGSQPKWDSMMLDRFAQRALQPGVLLDPSGIAKGYAVDLAAERLQAAGIAVFLLEIGGELCGRGVRPDGMPWWVEIESPPGAALPPARVALHGLSVATSGDYRRYFEQDGRRYSHSINPRSGRPIDNHVASAAVLHPGCMMADALATAITVLGPEEGMQFAERENLAVRMLVRAGDAVEERLSSAMERLEA